MSNIIHLPVIAGVQIIADEHGRFNLNSLHKASGTSAHKRPSKWLSTDATQELIEAVAEQSPLTGLGQNVVNSVKGGLKSGTFADEILAVAYAAWVSPKFHVQVNRAFLDMKTGNLQPAKHQIPQTLSEALRLSADLCDQLEAAKPKIAFADAVNDSINSVKVGDFAKSLNTGRNRLFNLLRDEGYLMSGFGKNNTPYQKHIDSGLFRQQEKTRRDVNGEIQTYFTTLITAKGQMHIQSKFFSQQVA